MQETSRRGGAGKMAAPVERMAHEQNTPPFCNVLSWWNFTQWVQDRAADRDLWAPGLCVCMCVQTVMWGSRMEKAGLAPGVPHLPSCSPWFLGCITDPHSWRQAPHLSLR